MKAKMLEIKGLSGGYNDLIVVRDISLDVSEGETVSVTGRNGVGKTTLMRLLSGSLPCSGSVVNFLGTDMINLAEHKRFALGISYAPQERIIFDDLSVEDNLTLHYQDTDLNRYDNYFEKFPRLRDRLKQRAGTLSGGEKKLLSFTRAVAEPTRLVLLDEPTEGVQSDNIELMAQIISDEKNKGRGFLIVDQNLTFLEDITDTIHLMDHGEQIYQANGVNFRTEIESRISI
jgi:ABC-type branched-subunit amino acid transport system ATPase component